MELESGRAAEDSRRHLATWWNHHMCWNSWTMAFVVPAALVDGPAELYLAEFGARVGIDGHLPVVVAGELVAELGRLVV